jgi:hypothetical protein
LELVANIDFVCQSIEATIGSNSERTTEQIFDTIRRRLPDPGFLLLLQKRGQECLGLLAAYIGDNIYGEGQGVIWLLHVRAGGNSRQMLEGFLLGWLKSFGVLTVVGADESFSRAKHRWGTRVLGFKLQCRLYKRRIDYAR